jgi:hypothetical protein
MPGVFREMVFDWDGKEYKLIPSNKLLRRIESQGELSIPKLAADWKRSPRFSEAAFILSEMYKEAGVKDIDEDQVFSELINMGAGGTQKMLNTLFEAIIPQERLKKNEDQNEPRKKLKK